MVLNAISHESFGSHKSHDDPLHGGSKQQKWIWFPAASNFGSQLRIDRSHAAQDDPTAGVVEGAEDGEVESVGAKVGALVTLLVGLAVVSCRY